MKFGQFISYYKTKNFIKKFCKNCYLKTSAKPFCVCKELIAELLLENEIFEASYFFQICNSRTITIYRNQNAYFRMSTQINTSLTRVSTSPTRVNTNQHESDTSQNESTQARHESTRINRSQYESIRPKNHNLCSLVGKV